jgi:hypothetical protein
MKKIAIILLSILLVIFLVRLNSKGKQITNHVKGIVQNTISKPNHINTSGDSISTRVKVPSGFKRVEYTKGSFQEYIPEAHCYLKINEDSVDITSAESDLKKIKEAILFEQVIVPEQVGEFKVSFHKDYVKKWIKEEKINFSFEEIWDIREECIAFLSKSSK